MREMEAGREVCKEGGREGERREDGRRKKKEKRLYLYRTKKVWK